MVPSTWFKQKEASSIWITGYYVTSVSKENFVSGFKVIDLYHCQARAILLYGTIQFGASQTKLKTIGDILRFEVKVDQQETPEGAYLLLLTPFEVDGNQGNEPLTRERISTVTGLFASFNGRNMVYQRLFDNILHLGTGELTGYSPIFENPFRLARPDISDSRFDTICKADKAIASLTEDVQNRVQLSLRWFASALYDTGVDAFLKYWIAIETLAMPNTTDIRPINESLSYVYKLSSDKEAKSRFKIGRLYGLRNNIVHNGQIVPIHGELLRYIEAIYTDILLGHLGLPCEQRATNVLDNPTFALNEYLQSVGCVVTHHTTPPKSQQNTR